MSITNQPRPTKQSASSPTGAARWNHGRARASAAGAGASSDGRSFSPPRWQPTVVTRLLRRRSVYWTLAVGLILLTIGVTYSQNRRASSIISSLGEQRDVLVAARDLGRGEAISREDFRIEQRPEGFVPLGALRWEDDDQVALEPIYASRGDFWCLGVLGQERICAYLLALALSPSLRAKTDYL